MRHVLRRAFNLCAGASAVLFAAACVLWVQSYHIPVDEGSSPSPEGVWFTSGHWLGAIDCLNGHVILYVATTSERNGFSIHGGVGDHFWWGNGSGNWLRTSSVGLQWGRASWSANGWWATMWAAMIPYPYFLGLSGLLSSVLLCRWRKKRRAPVGLCPACGYDLRASPEGGGAVLARCPECGTVPDGKAAR